MTTRHVCCCLLFRCCCASTGGCSWLWGLILSIRLLSLSGRTQLGAERRLAELKVLGGDVSIFFSFILIVILIVIIIFIIMILCRQNAMCHSDVACIDQIRNPKPHEPAYNQQWTPANHLCSLVLCLILFIAEWSHVQHSTAQHRTAQHSTAATLHHLSVHPERVLKQECLLCVIRHGQTKHECSRLAVGKCIRIATLFAS